MPDTGNTCIVCWGKTGIAIPVQEEAQRPVGSHEHVETKIKLFSIPEHWMFHIPLNNGAVSKATS
jgi:hypothetical protein